MVRFEYVQEAKTVPIAGAIGISGGKLKSVVLEMEYLPTLSKNSYKTREGIVRSEVKSWMEQFAFMLRALVNSQGLSFPLPVKVRVDGVFADRRSVPDLHNLLIVICDAVEDALGINDQFYKTETGQPEVGGSPRIIITVTPGERKKNGKKKKP